MWILYLMYVIRMVSGECVCVDSTWCVLCAALCVCVHVCVHVCVCACMCVREDGGGGGSLCV